MKKLILSLVMILLNVKHIQSQGIPISKTLFSINGWYINYSEMNLSNFGTEFTAYLGIIKASGCTHVCLGGISPNWDQIYDFDPTTRLVSNNDVSRLEKIIKAIRNAGMEVVIQVSCAPPEWASRASCSTYSPTGVHSLGNLSIAQQAEVAGNLVAALNGTAGVFKDNRIQHWSIANEPDHAVGTCTAPSGYGATATNNSASSDATLIAQYIKDFAVKMKTADPDILIMGPELASFGNDATINTVTGTYFNPSHRIMKDLLSNISNTYSILGPITSTNQSINGKFYVDIVTFHHYAISAFNQSTTDIITQPASANSGIAKTLDKSGGNFTGLIQMITGSGRSVGNVSIACTELNIDTHSQDDESTTLGYVGMINGFDNRSFLGGQWLVETFAEAMKANKGSTLNNVPWISMINLWSAREGSDKYITGVGNPLGYITGCNAPNGSTVNANYKRPMYHHYEMMANNFKGTFYPSTITFTGSSSSEIKAWAAQGTDRIAVLIINQSSSPRTFAVNLHNSTPTSADMRISFSIPNTSTVGYVGANADAAHEDIDAHSTVLLLFTCKGTPSERRDYKKSDVLTNPLATPTVVSLGNPLVGLFGISTNTTVIAMPGQYNAIGVTFTPTNNLTITWPTVGPCGSAVPNTNFGLTATLAACQGTTPVKYTYTVTDAEGCFVEEGHTVSPNMIVGPSFFYGWLGTPVAASCGLSNGHMSIGGSNFGQHVSFKWDNGSWMAPNSGTAACNNNSLSPGSHTVQICSSHASVAPSGTVLTYYFLIKEANKPPVSAGNDIFWGDWCPLDLSAWPNLGSGYTYQWYEVNGHQNTPIAPGITTTVNHWQNSIYKVVVTSTAVNTCKNEDLVQVTSHLRCGVRTRPGWNTYPCGVPNARPSGGIQTETLTANLVIDTDQYIDKIIVIPEGISLTLSKCELAMSDSSRFIVQAGGSLTASGVYFQPCDDDINKWDGFFGRGHSGMQIKIDSCVIVNGPIILEDAEGLQLQGNIFLDADTAVKMTACSDFTIRQNTFQDVGIGISTFASPTSTNVARILANYFLDVEKGITCQDDDHSNLSISCNIFENYADYAVFTVNTTLKNQGTASIGAGNEFYSSSSQTNHQFHHNGNDMKYYYGPSHTMSLTTSGSLNAESLAASNDPNCPDVQTSRPLAEVVSQKPLVSLEEKEISVKAYPNPFKDEFAIEYQLGIAVTSATLRIIESGSGKLVYEYQLDLNGSKLTIINTNLANGLYICSVTSNDGHVKRFKLVKMD